MEGRHPLHIDDLGVGVLANLEMPKGDMAALMSDLAFIGQLNGTLVVDPKCGGLKLCEAEIAKDLADVDGLGRCHRRSHDLRLTRREGNGLLPLAGIAHWGTSEHEDNARGRADCRRIRIAECLELRALAPVEEDAEVLCCDKVAQTLVGMSLRSDSGEGERACKIADRRRGIRTATWYLENKASDLGTVALEELLSGSISRLRACS